MAIVIVFKGSEMDCLVDKEDVAIVGYCSWSASWNPCTKSFYARGQHPNGTGKKVRMHSLICPPEEGKPMIDHGNHNTLDNRRFNLKAVARWENGLNRKGAQSNHRTGNRGAYYYKHLNKWQARVKFKNTSYYFGNHGSAESAVAAAEEGRKRLLAGEVIIKQPHCGRTPQVGTITGR